MHWLLLLSGETKTMRNVFSSHAIGSSIFSIIVQWHIPVLVLSHLCLLAMIRIGVSCLRFQTFTFSCFEMAIFPM